MTKRTSYEPALVLYLVNRLVKKFKQDYLLNNKVDFTSEKETELYGFGEAYTYPPQKEGTEVGDSIIKYVFEDVCKRKGYASDASNERKALGDKLKGKYLYSLKSQAAGSKKQVTIDKDYLQAYLGYLGLTDISDLQKDLEKEQVYYVGFYFSFLEFSIKNFILQISAYETQSGSFSATLKGIHSRSGVIDSETYVGEAIYEKEWLILFLKGVKEERRLNILAAVNNQEKSATVKGKHIRASVQGTTMKDNRIFSWEAFLHKTTHEDIITHTSKGSTMANGPVEPTIISQSDYQNIGFYLIMHRNVLAFQSVAVPERLSQLTVKKNKVSSVSDPMPGIYKIWSFFLKQKKGIKAKEIVVHQSKFVVQKNGIAHLYPFLPEVEEIPKSSIYYRAEKETWKGAASNDEQERKRERRRDLSKQSVLINVSAIDPNTQKVVVISFAAGLSMVNIGMFDLPRIPSDKIIEGCFASLANGERNISGYFVMKREDDFDIDVDQTQDVWEKNLNDVVALAEESGLTGFLGKLFEIYTKNSIEMEPGIAEEVGKSLGKLKSSTS